LGQTIAPQLLRLDVAYFRVGSRSQRHSRMPTSKAMRTKLKHSLIAPYLG
jgi:hypothetical protein